MTNTNSAKLSGEEKLRAKRRRFIRYVALTCLAFAVGGLVVGFASAAAEDAAIPPWILLPLIAASLVGFVVFSRNYFRRVDEVDLLDNLWASLIGMYFYIVAFPLWTLLDRVGYIGPPDHWLIWGATLALSMTAYLYRKFS